MSKEFKVAAYEGGKLRVLDSGSSSREVVLALPLSRLLVKLVRVEPGVEAVEIATPILKAMSPYPDDPLAVACETVRETEQGLVTLAAALPESSADDIAEALDAAKLNVMRIDVLELGILRGLWPQLPGQGRRLVLLDGIDAVALFVLDGDQPSAMRALSSGADLRREVMLSMLEAEDFGGAHALDEVVLVHGVGVPSERAEGEEGPAPLTCETLGAALAAFHPGVVRELSVGEDAGLAGVEERATEKGLLDVLPDSWRDVLNEARFKARLTRNVLVAVSFWVLAMGVLFGVPVAYGLLTDRVKDDCRQHARQYKAVSDMKAKVGIIEKYSDHARGALEMMKAVSDRVPEGVTLVSWDFKRADEIRLRGESEGTNPAYQLKDALTEMSTAGEEGERIFAAVSLGSLSAQRDGRQRFELTCSYKESEE